MNIPASVYLFLWEDDRRIDGRILMISKFVLCIPFTIKPIVLSFHSFHDLLDFLCLNMIVLFILLSKMKTKVLLYARFSSIPGVELGTGCMFSRAWHGLHFFPAHVTGSTVSRAWQNYCVCYAISLLQEKSYFTNSDQSRSRFLVTCETKTNKRSVYANFAAVIFKCPYRQNFYFLIWFYLSPNERLRKKNSIWIKCNGYKKF